MDIWWPLIRRQAIHTNLRAGRPGKSRAAKHGLVLASIFGVTWIVSWDADLPFFLANALVLGGPLAYIGWAFPSIKRAIDTKFLALLASFGTVCFCYLCERYGGWESHSILGLKVAGVMVIDELEWMVLYMLLALAVSECFYATSVRTPTNTFAQIALIALFFGGIVVALVQPLQAPLSQFVFVKVGVVVEGPVIALAVLANRHVARQLLITFAVFTPATFAYELLALHNDFWTFPGQYVATIPINGTNVPLEELLMVALSAPSVVAAYCVWKNWWSSGAQYLVSSDAMT